MKKATSGRGWISHPACSASYFRSSVESVWMNICNRGCTRARSWGWSFPPRHWTRFRFSTRKFRRCYQVCNSQIYCEEDFNWSTVSLYSNGCSTRKHLIQHLHHHTAWTDFLQRSTLLYGILLVPFSSFILLQMTRYSWLRPPLRKLASEGALSSIILIQKRPRRFSYAYLLAGVEGSSKFRRGYKGKKRKIVMWNMREGENVSVAKTRTGSGRVSRTRTGYWRRKRYVPVSQLNRWWNWPIIPASYTENVVKREFPEIPSSQVGNAELSSDVYVKTTHPLFSSTWILTNLLPTSYSSGNK